uniref:Uncharacterized protein n=1 Tax=Rhizophora mucronata TaxID=61149 RepID=A0A2P2R572_RHIMU
MTKWRKYLIPLAFLEKPVLLFSET